MAIEHRIDQPLQMLVRAIGRCALCLLLVAVSPIALADVETAKKLSADAAKSAAKAIHPYGHIRGIPVYQYEGDYSRGNTAARSAISQRYFQDYSDQVDALMVFTDFDFETNGATAFATRIKNDVQGIGLEPLDLSAQFGSNGKLYSYIDMAAMSQYSFNPGSPGFSELQGIAAHEFMHRFGAFIKYSRNGAAPTDLLGRDQAHWNFFLDSDASVMYGAKWQQANGQFTAIEVLERFSALDLYLAGLRSSAEVPPITLIRNGSGASSTDLPLLGHRTGGTIETVTIDQVIAANGPRVPNHLNAQRRFKIGLALVLRPDSEFQEQTITDLLRFARALETRFTAMTEGRATLSMRNQARGDLGGNSPQPLVGSPTCTENCATDFGKAQTWLLAQQQASGAIVDHVALSYQSTASAYRALRLLGGNEPALGNARNLLQSQVRAWSDESLGDYVLALAPSTSEFQESNLGVDWLARINQGDTGLLGGYQSAHDIASLLSAIEAGYVPVEQVRKEALLSALLLMQNPDGSFGVSPGGVGHVVTTARVLQSLAGLAEPQATTMTTMAASWLSLQQRIDGAYGDGDASLSTALAMEALSSRDPSLIHGQSSQFLATRQGSSGDWAGSALATGQALRTLYQMQRPDLSFFEPGITVSPANVTQGETVTLSVRATNRGSVASNVTLSWYDGNPSQGGTLIGSVAQLGTLFTEQSRTATVSLEEIRPAGNRTIFAVLDAADSVSETNETNNSASISFVVAPLPATADAALVRSDFTVAPAAVTTFPTEVHVTGQVKNLGGVAMNNVPIRIVQTQNGQVLERASSVVSAAAEGFAPIALSFTLNETDSSVFTLQVDPDNTLAEIRETNNELVFSLGTDRQVNLEVLNADLSLLTNPAVRGQLADVRVIARNTGLLDSANFDISAELTLAGQTTRPTPIRIQIPARQSRERIISVPLPAVGTASLRISLDEAQETTDIDRSNNVASISFEVTDVTAPNLQWVPGSLTLSPLPLMQGQAATARMRLRNVGSAIGSNVHFRVETGAANGPRSVLASDNLVGGLAEGAEVEIELPLGNLSAAGERYFFASADPDNAIAESNEGDNIAFVTLPVRSIADAAVTVASIRLTPTIPTSGQAVSAELTVRNLGDQAISNLALALYEGAPGTGVLVPNTPVIENIAAGASATVSVSWTFGLLANAQLLTFVVDPENLIAEQREDNNTAVLSLAQSSANFVDESFFSPNGDGIKDTATARFGEPLNGLDHVVIVDIADRPVRAFARDELVIANGAAIRWDGRKDDGTLARDDDYRFQARTIDGQVLAQLAVTLDTNRAPILEAAGSNLSKITTVPRSTYHAMPGKLAVDPNQIVLSEPDNLATATTNDRLPGLYRFDLLKGELSPVISTAWLTANTADTAIRLLSEIGPGDEVLFLLRARTGATYTLWRTSIFASDAAQPVAVIEPPAGGYFSDMERLSEQEAVIWGGPRANTAVRLVDLHLGTVTALNGGAMEAYEVKATRHGIVFYGDYYDGASEYFQLSLVSRDPGVPPRTYLGYPLYEGISSGFGELGAVIHERVGTLESVSWVDFESGAKTTLAAINNPDIGCYLATERVRDRNMVAVINPLAREVQLVDLDSGVARQVQLPAMQRQEAYKPSALLVTSNTVYTYQQMAIENMPYYEDCHWGLYEPNIVANAPKEKAESKGAAKRFPDPLESGFVDYQHGVARLIVPMGEGIRARRADSGVEFLVPGAIDLFEINIDSGVAKRLGGVSSWPLKSYGPDSAYPHIYESHNYYDAAFAERLLLEVTEYLLKKQGINIDLEPMLLSDGSAAFEARELGTDFFLPNGRQFTVESANWRSAFSIESETMVALDSLRNGSAPFYSSLANLSVSLSASRNSNGVALAGIAADRNFREYELSWSQAHAPNDWHPIGGISQAMSTGGELMNWSPPAAGQYRVRLRAEDLAGNVRSDETTVFTPVSSDISDVSFSNPSFSPNGDGVKDDNHVQFTVLRPTEFAIEVFDMQRQLLRQFSRLYDQAGPYSWTWDGRNEQGVVVPDGQYRIVIAGGQFSRLTVVDTVPPRIAVQRQASDLCSAIEGAIKGNRDDTNLPFYVEQNSVDSVLSYEVLDPLKDGLKGEVAQWDGTNSVAIGYGVEGCLDIDPNTRYGYRYRVTDAAGNSVSNNTPDLADEVRLLASLISTDNIPTADQLPIGKLVSRSDFPSIAQRYAYTYDADAQRVVYNLADGQSRLAAGQEIALDVWLRTELAVDHVQAALAIGNQNVSIWPLKRIERVGDRARLVFNAPDFSLFENPTAAPVSLLADIQLANGQTLKVEEVRLNASNRRLEFQDFVDHPSGENWQRYGLSNADFFALDNTHLLADFEYELPELAQRVSVQVNMIPGAPVGVAGAVKILSDHLLIKVPKQCQRFRVTAVTQSGVEVRSIDVPCRAVSVEIKPTYQQCGIDSALPFSLVGNAYDASVDILEIASISVRLASSPPEAAPLLSVEASDSRIQCEGNVCSFTGLMIAPANLPPGNVQLTTTVTLSSGAEFSNTIAINNRNVHPEIDLSDLGPDGRMCFDVSSDVDGNRYTLKNNIRIAPVEEAQYALRIGPIPPAEVADLQIPLPDAESISDDLAPGFGGWSAAAPRSAQDAFNFNQPLTAPDNGTPLPLLRGSATLRVATANSLGLLQCTDFEVQVDPGVEIDYYYGWPARGVINPLSGGEFRTFNTVFYLDEPLSVSVALKPLDASSELPLVENLSLSNSYWQWSWNGRMPDNSVAPDGKYHIIFAFTDECGFERRIEFPVAVDTRVPVINIDTPESGELWRGPVVNIAAHVDDGIADATDYAYSVSAIAGREITLREDLLSSNGEIDVPWYRGQVSGDVSVTIKVTDHVGNQATQSRSFRLSDRLTPFFTDARVEPQFISPNGDGVSESTILNYSLERACELTARVLSPDRTPLITLVNREPRTATPGTVLWRGEGLGAGPIDARYWLELTASNPADPNDTETLLLPVVVDTVPPLLTMTNPSGAFARNQGFVTVDVVDSNFATGNWQIPAIFYSGGLRPGSNDLLTMAELTEGMQRLFMTAQDRAGNRSEKAVEFELDMFAPDARIDQPTEGALLGGTAHSALIVGRAFDRYFDRYELSLAATATPDQWLGLHASTTAVEQGELGTLNLNRPDGNYILRLQAFDRADAVSTAEVQIGIDRTPPEVAIADPLPNALVKRQLRVLGTATDAHMRDIRVRIATLDQAAANVWSDLSVDSQPVSNGELAALTLNVPDGEYILQVRAEDDVGLFSSSEVRVRLDSEAPATPLNLIGTVQGGDALLNWQGAPTPDFASYLVYRNGNVISAAPLTVAEYRDVDAPEGALQYQVSAIDAAGNESARSNTVDLNLDRSPPEASINSPRDGEHLGLSTDVIGRAWSANDFSRYQLSLAPLSDLADQTILADSPQAVASGRLATLDVENLVEGSSYRLSLSVYDTRGNSAEVQHTFQVDRVPPAAPLQLTAVADNADAVLNWSANSEPDLLGYVLLRNGRPVGSLGSVPGDLRRFAITATTYRDLSLPDGQHQWQVIAIDRAGNTSAPSNLVELTFNGRPPQLQLTAPLPNQEFEGSVFIRAYSPDADVVEVAYDYRKVGNSAWLPLASALTGSPWEYLWTPGPLPYAEYEIRGRATDSQGLNVQNPPMVRVRYSDLTAPDAVASITAVGRGDSVQLTWPAVDAPDLANYQVQYSEPGSNNWATAGSTSNTSLLHSRSQDGEFIYRVRAIDATGNLGDWSATESARIFTLKVDAPKSPMRLNVARLQGSSPIAGNLVVQHTHNGQSSVLATMTVAGNTGFMLDNLNVLSGENVFALEVTDAEDNVSRRSSYTVVHGASPSVPTGLTLSLVTGTLTALWNANPEANILGYRVWRRGFPRQPDLAPPRPTLTSDLGGSTSYAMDGNVNTAWLDGYYFPAGEVSGELKLQFDRSYLISTIQLRWKPGMAPARYRVDGYGPHGFAPIEVIDNRVDIVDVALPDAWYGDKVRIVLLESARAGDAIALAEVGVKVRPYLTATQFIETLTDGAYNYQVSAVNSLGFESDKTAPQFVEQGDVTPPDPVVLTGLVQLSDAVLSWGTSSSVDIGKYEVYRDDQRLGETVPAVRTWLDRNRPNGSAVYKVVAVDRYENRSVDSNLVTLTFAVTLPATPQLTITAPDVGAALDLQWQPGATGAAVVRWTIRRADAETGPFSVIAERTDLGMRDQPLINGRQYWYTVEGFDAAGQSSGQSNPVAGTPNDSVAPVVEPSWPVFPDERMASTTRQAIVAGRANPGDQVSVGVNGLIQTVSAPLQDRVLRVGNAVLGTYQTYSGDGALIGGGTEWADVDAGQIAGSRIDLPWTNHNAIGSAWAISRDGRFLGLRNGVWTWEDPRVAGSETTQPLPIVNVTQLAVRDDLAYALARVGTTVHVIDLKTQTSRPLSGLPSNSDLGSVEFSTGGNWALLQSTNGSLLRVDLRNASSININSVSVQSYAVAADGRVWYVGGSGTTSQIVRYDQGQYWGMGLGRAVALSAFEDELAVATQGTGQIELRHPDFGSVLRSIDVSTRPLNALIWTRSQRLFANDGTDSFVIDLAGSFRSSAFALRDGENAVSARATDDSGQSSGETEPGYIDVPSGSQLPDLAVNASEILFQPSSGPVGQAYSAQVQVRNLGRAQSFATTMAVALISPDGSRQNLASALAIPGLAIGGRVSVPVNLGVLPTAGAYYLDVAVDQNQVVEEANEQNNQAMARLLLGASAMPILDLVAHPTLLAPDGTLLGETRVTNLGTTFNGSVSRRIETATGVLVADLGQHGISNLAFGTSHMKPLTWSATGSAAQGYRLLAVLRDAAGAELARRELPLIVALSRNLNLDAASDSARYGLGQTVSLRSQYAFPAGNVAIENAALRLTVLDGAGVERDRFERALGTLLVGASGTVSRQWQAQSPVGLHTVKAELLEAGQVIASAQNNFYVEALIEPERLTGSITPIPSAFAAGSEMRIDFAMQSNAASARSVADLRLRLFDAVGSEQLAMAQVTGAVSANSALLGTLNLSALNLPVASYLALLDARLEGDSQYQILANESVVVRDLLPPQIVLRMPVANTWLRSPIELAAKVTDAHSGVDQVEFAIDGGEFDASSVRPDGLYGSLVEALTQGQHVVVVRARDRAGNVAESAPQPFVVDNEAPVITIAGVSDGQQSRVPLVPVISITDDNLSQSSIRLNGSDFVSASTVSADGQYVLQVNASDLAGNSATRTLRFLIDATPPSLMFEEPLDGAETTAANADARIRTEADAEVWLTAGPYSANGRADTQGAVQFAAVPLLVGVNNFSAFARDALGNESAPVSVQIRRIDNSAQPLLGSLIPGAAQFALGENVALHWQISNPGAEPRTDLLYEISARHLGTDALLGDSRNTIGIAGNSSVGDVLNLPSNGKPLGIYVASLRAQDAGVWVNLASTSFELVDRQPPVITVLRPTVGELIGQVFRVRAEVTDVLGSVAQVQVSISGGPWQDMTLADAANNVWESADVDLPDDEYGLAVRAFDNVGNSAQSGLLAFVVDRTAPLIQISGVSDGGVYASVVRPDIAVADLHLESQSITLNGSPFVSGTDISGDGDYVLQVNAQDAAGNVSQRSLSFAIDLTPPVIGFTFPLNNAIIGTSPIDVGGLTEAFVAVEFRSGGQTANVSADAQGGFIIPAVSLIEGANLLEARARDALGNTSDWAALGLHYRPNAGASVSATLSIAPISLPLGQSAQASFEIRNTGSVPISNLPVALRFVRVADQFALARRDMAVSLAINAAQTGSESFASTDTLPGAHIVVLEAQMTDSNGQTAWVTLATQTVDVLDVLAPQVQFISPDPGGFVPGQFAVEVSALDLHSPMAEVLANADGFAPTVLQAGNAGRYHGELNVDREGLVDLHAEATDSAGNRGQAATRAVIVDLHPPVIAIAGVTEGQLYNVAVTPTVAITDFSPVQTSITLNGEAWTSGSRIDRDGEYLLTVRAEDALARVSSVERRFNIDRTAPPIRIVDPKDGAIVYADQVAVLGQTEALADVLLTADGFSAPTLADANGVFSLSNVPLRPGQNLIRVQATDRAGNIGPEATVRVERRAVPVVEVQGDIGLAATDWINGTDLVVPLLVRNTGTAALTELPVRLQVIDAGNQTLAERSYTLDLQPGAADQRSLSLPTRDFGLGKITLKLNATLPGRASTQVLDTHSLNMLDRELPTVSFVAPTANQRIPVGFAVVALASDRLNAIQNVLLSIDNSPGSPMTTLDVVAGRYGIHLPEVSLGPHQLHLQAFDAAGNASVKITLNIVVIGTLPLSISEPQNGSSMPVQAIALRGQTAANANVRLNRGGDTWNTIADGQGRFEFMSLPLRVGDNLFVATASDNFGNESAGVSVTVIGTGSAATALEKVPLAPWLPVIVAVLLLGLTWRERIRSRGHSMPSQVQP